MSTEFVAHGYEKKDHTIIGTLNLRTSGMVDYVVTADGTKSLLALIQDLCAEVVAKVPPGAPVPKEWEQLLTVPAVGTTVVIASGFRAETR